MTDYRAYKQKNTQRSWLILQKQKEKAQKKLFTKHQK